MAATEAERIERLTTRTQNLCNTGDWLLVLGILGGLGLPLSAWLLHGRLGQDSWVLPILGALAVLLAGLLHHLAARSKLQLQRSGVDLDEQAND